MKKILFLLFVLLGTLSAHADGYAYLTFETSDGLKTSVSTDGLAIIISGTTLKAGQKSFVLSNLSKMYFSETDQTVSAIRTATAPSFDEASEIYNLKGQRMERSRLTSGTYIVKTPQGTYKIAVK